MIAWGLDFFPLGTQRGGFPAEPSPEQTQGITRGQTEKGILYMSGGVGTEERAQMKKLTEAYNLGLSFAGKSRQYLTDIKLVILDANGNEIIGTIADGPWFYIQLPPGSYNVNAMFKDKTHEVKNLRIPRAGRVLRTLIWDVD
jgi:hypothetical protein